MPSLRPSDAERERALRALKAHYVEGRIGAEELERRIDDVYRAGGRRQLAIHLRGMPSRGLRALLLRRARGLQRAVLGMHLLTFVTINASLVGIWGLTGEGSFWPALMLVPSAAFLGWHIVASRALTRALSRLEP